MKHEQHPGAAPPALLPRRCLGVPSYAAIVHIADNGPLAEATSKAKGASKCAALAVVRRALTGLVMDELQRRDSTVRLDEKRAAVAGVLRLVPPETAHRKVGSRWGFGVLEG